MNFIIGPPAAGSLHHGLWLPRICDYLLAKAATSSRELPNREWTRRMLTLTCDFDVFTSRVTASFSAVFFSAGYIEEKHGMCAHFFVSRFAITTPSFRIQPCLRRFLEHCDS
jgi:hypothetical protein